MLTLDGNQDITKDRKADEMTLPLPVCSPASGLFVGCDVWDRNSTLDNALKIALDNDLTADDAGSTIWFQNAQGECVAFWHPQND